MSRLQKIIIYSHILVSFALTTYCIHLYTTRNSLELDVFHMYESVPHIKLLNTLSFSDANNVTGQVTGLVAFENLTDQPRINRQYFTITPTRKLDEYGKQIFILREYYKLPYISISEADARILGVDQDDAESIQLKDEYSNWYKINKLNNEIQIRGVDGDIAYLITNDTEYKDLIRTLKDR